MGFMLLHPHYRKTVTELEALTTLIDATGNLPSNKWMDRAIKRANERTEVLRKRLAMNRRNRGKNKETK